MNAIAIYKCLQCGKIFETKFYNQPGQNLMAWLLESHKNGASDYHRCDAATIGVARNRRGQVHGTTEVTRELTAIPFGKWKNVPIEDVDTDYLRWAIDNWDAQDKPEVYELVENEYIRRKQQGLA